jgi:hypothetical protein
MEGGIFAPGSSAAIVKQIQFFGLLDPKPFLTRGRSTGIFYPESK